MEIRVTVNRKPYYINTGVRVQKERFVAGSIRDVAGTCDADDLNNRLTIISHMVEKEVNACLDERRPIDVTEIRQKVWSVVPAIADDKTTPTMVDWIR